MRVDVFLNISSLNLSENYLKQVCKTYEELKRKTYAKHTFSTKLMILGFMVGTLGSPKLVENKLSRESGKDRSIRRKKMHEAEP